jgi:Fe-S cluster assembly protein SufD
MNKASELATLYRERLGAEAAGLPGARLEWLRERRAAAVRQLTELGFPGQRTESWRYTNVSPLLEQVFEPPALVPAVSDGDLEPLFLPDGPCLVLVNGRLSPALCRLEGLPEGVEACGLAQALERWPQRVQSLLFGQAPERSFFTAMNSAGSGDGAYLHLAAGADPGLHLDILHVTTELDPPVMAQPRNLIHLAAGAVASVSERFVGMGAARYFTNTCTRVLLGPRARLTHYRAQVESDSAFHIGALDIALEADARYQGHQLTLGGRLGRTDVEVAYQGAGAACALNGLFLAHHGQLLDFHTNVEHAYPRCRTRERFKGILCGRGRGVFDGRIHVHPHAQGSDAQMSNDNLLLSRDAEVDTKPQLQIYADDVKCSHGATVGQLDPDALFYLRSRGLQESEAQHLLTRGFALDLLEAMGDGPAALWMAGALERRLEALHV